MGDAMKKKIMFFINSLGGGGAEKVLTNLLRKLDREKYVVTVVTVFGGENLKRIPAWVKVRQLVKGCGCFSSFFGKCLCHLPKKLFASLFLRGTYASSTPTAC